jgi:FkbM family methyltransferase
MLQRNIKVHCAAIHDEEKELPFYITNNGQSSSLLTFGTHKQNYPNICVSKIVTVKTKKLQTLVQDAGIDITRRNFWNLDIQGSELAALKSAGDLIQFADAIYIEVNTEEVYQGCGKLDELDSYLQSKGFLRVKTEMTRAGWGDALFLRVN